MDATDRSDRIENAHRDNKRQGLRAPVHSIIGYADFLKEELQSLNPDPDDRATINMICTASRQLADQTTAYTQSDLDDESYRLLRHDIRNTVGVIDGYAQMLIEDFEHEPAANSDTEAAHDSCLRYLVSISAESQHVLVALEDGEQTDNAVGESAAVAKVFESFRAGIERDKSDVIVGKILVVDDNDSSRDLLAHQLKREGHDVLHAASGSGAITQMREKAPDLVLLDLIMPDNEWLRSTDLDARRRGTASHPRYCDQWSYR